MSEKRLCRNCREPLGVDDEVCRACGSQNPVVLPWYIYPLGFAMIFVIGWLLIDFEAIKAYIFRT